MNLLSFKEDFNVLYQYKILRASNVAWYLLPLQFKKTRIVQSYNQKPIKSVLQQ